MSQASLRNCIFFSSHQLQVSFKPMNTQRQKLVHPTDKPTQDKINRYSLCNSVSKHWYVGETKQTLAKHMYQHQRTSTGCGNSFVYQHLDSSNHSFINKDVIILDREHRWYRRGVKEAIQGVKKQNKNIKNIHTMPDSTYHCALPAYSEGRLSTIHSSQWQTC